MPLPRSGLGSDEDICHDFKSMRRCHLLIRGSCCSTRRMVQPSPQNEGEGEAAAAAASSEILRLSCALAVDMQYVLSNQEYCHVFDAFSFTPERKCLCGRQFDDTIASPRAGRDVNGKAETAVPRNPPCRPPRTARPTGVTGADTQPFDDRYD